MPPVPTFRSHTRNGTLPSRFESSELLTYKRRLAGVSFVMFGSCSLTSLTNLGCRGSATSYCCRALPLKGDTYRSRWSYEVGTSAGVEFAGSWVTRVYEPLRS